MKNRFRYYIIYKPYGTASQFSPLDGLKSLSDFFPFPGGVYPVGRLDADSEGLLLLTSDKKLNHRLLDPKFQHKRTYLVQLDGAVTDEAAAVLSTGVTITVNGKPYKTSPATVKKNPELPVLPPRNPPIRYRKNIPTSWIELTLCEGKNRQVRKMTAAAGFPTLRLIRYAIEGITLDDLQGKKIMELSEKDIYEKLHIKK